MKTKISRHAGRLDYLRERVVEFLRAHGIEESAVSAIELSAYEAASNIIEHGNKDYLDRNIAVETRIGDGKVEVTLTYYDERFDLTAAPMPDVDAHYRSGKKRGLGIYFIRRLMDSVEYDHNEMINTLKMMKNI